MAHHVSDSPLVEHVQHGIGDKLFRAWGLQGVGVIGLRVFRF